MTNRMLRFLTTLLLTVSLTITSSPIALAAKTTVSENPADYTPHIINSTININGTINQYSLVGTTMYAAGAITTVKSADLKYSYTRHNIMAFNALTGQVLDGQVINGQQTKRFAPNINGEVWGMEPTSDGKYMYISGAFTSVDGVARRGVVKYDLVNNQVDTRFDAQLDARATVVKLVHGQLIIAGSFNHVGSAARTALASVDPDTGAVTPYINLEIAGSQNDEPTRIYRFSVNPANDRMVVIGNFKTISGQSREQAAMVILDPTSSRLSGWNSLSLYGQCTKDDYWYLRDVDWSDDGKWFVIVSAAASQNQSSGLCDSASRWEWPSKQSNPGSSVPTWINYTGGDSLHSVTIVGNVVYVGGHQRWLNNPSRWVDNPTMLRPSTVSRPGIGAISGLTGNAAGWNPTRSRGQGAKELYYTNIPGAHGLWIGSDTDELGHEYHASIGFFPQ